MSDLSLSEARELRAELELIDSLLKSIRQSFDELPSRDELGELSEAADGTLTSLSAIPKAIEDLPDCESLSELSEAADGICNSLVGSQQAWENLTVTVDELNELAEAAGNIAAGLQSAE